MHPKYAGSIGPSVWHSDVGRKGFQDGLLVYEAFEQYDSVEDKCLTALKYMLLSKIHATKCGRSSEQFVSGKLALKYVGSRYRGHEAGGASKQE